MIQPVRNSRSARRAILTRLLLWLFMAGFALATPRLGLAALQSSSESEQEERYNQAVQAYTQNRFTDARTLFEGVRGSHSEEAKKYLGNIKAYKDAMEEAEGIMQRSPDELDPANLDVAIAKYQEASAIKSVTQSSQVERVFSEFEPDLMLLDLHMPAPDGLEILRNLRSVRESLGFLPVIVLTGDTGRTARNSALLLGADDFLIKPLDRQEVVLRVRNLLRTRRLYVELAEANRALENKLH